MNKLHEQNLTDFIQKSLLKDKKVKVGKDTLLFKEGLVDSMNILDLIGFIEKQTGKRLSDDQIIMSNFQSVNLMLEAFADGK